MTKDLMLRLMRSRFCPLYVPIKAAMFAVSQSIAAPCSPARKAKFGIVIEINHFDTAVGILQ
jgi:hypothetical protein